MARNKSVKDKVQENTDRLRAVVPVANPELDLPWVAAPRRERSLRYLAMTLTPAQIRALESILMPLPEPEQPTE